ncbi:uncharacterized protein LOC111013431 [Momordica charantia]|uniref:Uncharacterized protein LOC111013431 n=1 Tax=Momordica charantia TaxID=3673 RepID=A0A6J1CR66_MOMCH|nr:uncharacterized protein LOC111013431 [Momordica charantia]
MKDSGSFTSPVSIEGHKIDQVLCDFGASVNRMPLSVIKRLGMGEVRPTIVTLQLADRSIANPEEKIEDVLAFLSTRRPLVDVHQGEVTMRVQDQEIKFSIYDSMKYPSDAEECAFLRVLDEAVMAMLSVEVMLEHQNNELNSMMEQADEICQEIL